MYERPKLMPDLPLWSFDGSLSVALLVISAICAIVVCVCPLWKPKFSIQRQIISCFWLPIVSIVFLITKRISYESWVFHYYGTSSDPSQVAEDRAIVVGNVSCFVLLLFFMIVIKITASTMEQRETNKSEQATPRKPSD